MKMETREIVKNPSPILRERSREIQNPRDPFVLKLIPVMVKTMIKANGVGIAAPQIGENIRLIIVNAKDGPFPCINPIIEKTSWLTSEDEEGCLSVPGVYGRVKRKKRIRVSFLDQYGKRITISASGLLARIFQHEVDHINGILFIDKAKNIQNLPRMDLDHA